MNASTNDTNNKVYLIDGSGYIFRAYYAVRGLTTSHGFPTNALYGFTKMLLKLLLTPDASRVIVCFDVSKDTFRKELFPQYKANRSECPEDLVPQLPFFREISVALGLRVAEKEGFEADDIIGTLAKRFVATGSEVVIVSADKDLMQLVTDKVTIWDTMKDAKYGVAEVQEKMGVPPELVVDLLGLMGDSSDNIPGLAGVGPKTALQLIERYGSVEGVIASAKEISQDKTIRNRAKISQQIESDVETLRMSKTLATIDCQASVDIRDATQVVSVEDVDDEFLLNLVCRTEPAYETLQELIEKLEFASLFQATNFDFSKKQGKVSTVGEYKTIFKSNFETWLAEFKQQTAFAFDIETTALNVFDLDLVGISFCWDDEKASYIPLGHKENESGEEQVSIEELIKAISPHLKDPLIKKYGQNLKFDIKVLSRYGVEVEGVAFDTMLASYLLNSDGIDHTLGALALRYLGVTPSEYEDVTKGLQDFSFTKIAAATQYAAEDAHLAWLLTAGLLPMIKDRGLLHLMEDIELPLISVLAKMELRGIKLDVEVLQAMSKVLEERLALLIKDIYELAGTEFNINSPKQLSEILYNKLQIPTKGVRKIKTGYSTDSETLEFLSIQHDLPRYLLEYRMLHKLKSTYVDALPAQVSPKTNRLHTQFNQMVTGTGRLSSSDPNLQNIPIQTEEGRKIGRAHV